MDKSKYVSKCCQDDTYLGTSIWMDTKQGKRVPFRNNLYCKGCKQVCILVKLENEELENEKT
jgi:hypothetical protein